MNNELGLQTVLALRPLTAKNMQKAILQMITSFVPYIALWFVAFQLWDVTLLGSVLVMILNAFFLVRIFIIQHDCGHHSYFDPMKYGKLQSIIGWMSSVFSTLPFIYWATVHHHHHVHTGQLEERDIGDLDFMTVEEFRAAKPMKRLGYRIFRHPIVLFVFAPIVYFLISNRWPLFFSFKKMTVQVRWLQVWNNLLIFAVYSGGVLLLGWKFLVVQGITLFFFSIIAFWFFYVQHAHEYTYQRWKGRNEWYYIPAALQGASRYDIHPVLHWLTGNIGYHHLHHLNPAIPSYNLIAADKATFSQVEHIVQNLSFRESLDCMNNHLWDEELQKYISFREFYARG
jgi:omega-6 fatty acid desaturase (delta-12 desaturase)